MKLKKGFKLKSGYKLREESNKHNINIKTVAKKKKKSKKV